LSIESLITAIQCQIKEDYDLASAFPLYFGAQYTAHHLADVLTSLPELMISDQEQSRHADRCGLHFRSPALVRGNGPCSQYLDMALHY
jgi:hypothetical protein